MLIGTIRSTSSRTLTLEGNDLAALRAELYAHEQAPWQVTKHGVSMGAAGGGITLSGELSDRTVREIEAEDMPALRAAVEEGWALIAVRRV